MFLHFCDYLPFEEDLALALYNVKSPLPKDDLYQVWLKLACWFWRKDFSPKINTCKNGFPHCGPGQPPGTMICTNLNLQCFGKLLCKSKLFWLVVREKIFKLLHTIFVIISPLKRTWPLICTMLNSLYLKMTCTKFDWNWPAGSGKDF
jgi:hypothetical protein